MNLRALWRDAQLMGACLVIGALFIAVAIEAKVRRL